MVAIIIIIEPSYKVQIKRNEHIPELCLISGYGVCSECVMTTSYENLQDHRSCNNNISPSFLIILIKSRTKFKY